MVTEDGDGAHVFLGSIPHPHVQPSEPVPEMKDLRLREAEQRIPGRTARKWQSQDVDPVWFVTLNFVIQCDIKAKRKDG